MDQSPIIEDAIIEGEIIDSVEGMTFGEAMKAVVAGERVTKLEWDNDKITGFLEGGILKLQHEDKTIHEWIVNDGDLTGNDYVIV